MRRAADAMDMTQPGVSAQIKALEHELGTTLFVRQSRGVVPNETADSLAREIAASIDALDVALTSRVARTSEISGRINIGAPPEMFSAYGPRIMQALDHPDLTLRAKLGNRVALHGGLADGSLDLAITASAPEDKTFGSQAIGYERLRLVAHPDVGHDLDAPLLAYDEDCPLVTEWMAAHRPDMRLPVPKLTVGDLRSLCRLLPVLKGWSVLPEYLATESLADGVLVTPDPRTVQNAFHIVWKRSRLRTPRVAYARDRLLEVTLKPGSSAPTPSSKSIP